MFSELFDIILGQLAQVYNFNAQIYTREIIAEVLVVLANLHHFNDMCLLFCNKNMILVDGFYFEYFFIWVFLLYHHLFRFNFVSQVRLAVVLDYLYYVQLDSIFLFNILAN